MNYKENPELFEKKSEILKALAHPVRLCIVKGLIEKGSCNVTHMQNCLETPQSTLSQHLSKLKSVGILKSEKFGLEIKYSIKNKEIKNLINILFKEEIK